MLDSLSLSSHTHTHTRTLLKLHQIYSTAEHKEIMQSLCNTFIVYVGEVAEVH